MLETDCESFIGFRVGIIGATSIDRDERVDDDFDSEDVSKEGSLVQMMNVGTPIVFQLARVYRRTVHLEWCNQIICIWHTLSR